MILIWHTLICSAHLFTTFLGLSLVGTVVFLPLHWLLRRHLAQGVLTQQLENLRFIFKCHRDNFSLPKKSTSNTLSYLSLFFYICLPSFPFSLFLNLSRGGWHYWVIFHSTQCQVVNIMREWIEWERVSTPKSWLKVVRVQLHGGKGDGRGLSLEERMTSKYFEFWHNVICPGFVSPSSSNVFRTSHMLRTVRRYLIKRTRTTAVPESRAIICCFCYLALTITFRTVPWDNWLT